jgi:hypothetical protein
LTGIGTLAIGGGLLFMMKATAQPEQAPVD